METKPIKNVSACGHLHNVMTHEDVSSRVAAITSRLRKVVGEFDAIAFRGVSGALVAPIVAHKLKKDLIVVRKGEQSHSNYKVEGVRCERYIIVDDFVASADTLNTISNEIYDWHPKAKLVGVALYNTDEMSHGTKMFLLKMFNLGVWLIHSESTAPMYPKKNEV